MSNHSDVKILELTDLHIGRPNVPPHMVHEHLVKYVYPKLEEIQILAIVGDFFDRLCNLNSDDGIYAALIVDELIQYAERYQFYIRVVRGTFSHDRYQNRLFLTKNYRNPLMLHNKPLVRVIDNIELELFEDLKISVVYCPDDQPYQDVTQAVIDVIEAHKLKKVDFLFSHGYWEHLLPKGLTQLPHNTLIYNRIEPYIQGAILNGHVHIPNVYKKVFNGGSFERLQHGEEEDKGYFLLTYTPTTHKIQYTFVINEDAIPFVTVDLDTTFNVEDALIRIGSVVDKIREQRKDPDLKIFLRIAGNSDFVAAYVKDNFHNVVVTKKSTVTQDVNTEELVQVLDELPVITEDNLPSMIAESLKGTDTPLTEQEIKEILDDTAN